MKPKVQNRLQLGFYSRFEDQLNPGHPLYQLANKIDWSGFERDFLPLYCADNGRPARSAPRCVGDHSNFYLNSFVFRQKIGSKHKHLASQNYPPASAKLPNTKPNARWREGFSLVPSISVGCADKRKAGKLVQSGIIDIAKEPTTILLKSRP